MKSQEMIQGVYVHTPFCLQKCLYCDFPSYAGCSADVRERYVRALCREIRQGRADGWYGALPVAPDATIYFGGGTPTVLTTDQLGRVVAALREAGWWNRPAEATVEANPGTVDASSLRALRELGFTRVSLGVQSLQDRELRAIGRIHTAAEAKEAVALAKAAGFERVSIDLMYGLPGQTLDSYGKTLEEAAALGLRHVSAYSLILEEGTPLERLVASGRVTLPDEDTVYAMYEATDRFWTARGLRRYEISNYAAPGQESRHNQVYWRYEPYAAFGAAACGFDGRRRRTNPAGVADYLAAVEAGLPAGAGPRTPGTLPSGQEISLRAERLRQRRGVPGGTKKTWTSRPAWKRPSSWASGWFRACPWRSWAPASASTSAPYIRKKWRISSTGACSTWTGTAWP